MEINSFKCLKASRRKRSFSSKLRLNAKLPNAFPSFYRNLLSHWCENFSHYSDSKGEISSEYIWYNKYIRIDNLQKSFVWKSKKPKIKHSTLIRDYSEGSLKEVDIKSKIVALQLTWIRRLNDGNFHPWKLIPLNVLKPPGGSAVFHQNLDLTPNYQMHSLVSTETYCPTGVKIFPTILIQKVRFLQSISGTINIFELLGSRFRLELWKSEVSSIFLIYFLKMVLGPH